MGAIFRRNGFGKDPAFLTWKRNRVCWQKVVNLSKKNSHCFCEIVLLEGWRILWWTTIKLTENTFQPKTINITYYVKLEKTSRNINCRVGSCLSISASRVLPGRIHHWVTKSKSPLGWSWHKILHITWNQLRDWWTTQSTDACRHTWPDRIASTTSDFTEGALECRSNLAQHQSAWGINQSF